MSSTRLKLGLAVLLAAVGLFLLGRGLGLSPGAEGGGARRSPAEVVDVLQKHLPPPAEEDGTPPPAPAAGSDRAVVSTSPSRIAAESGSEETAIRLQVDSSEGLPPSSRRIRVYGEDRYRIDQVIWSGTLDEAGSAECTLPPGSWWIALHAAPSMLWDLSVPGDGAPIAWRGELPHTRLGRARCIDTEGQPVAGAMLYAAADLDASRAFPLDRTGPDG